MQTLNYETSYNRHILGARKFAKGTTGYERAQKITEYFHENDHPHAYVTFEQLAINRTSDAQLARKIIKDMAWLVALNETIID